MQKKLWARIKETVADAFGPADIEPKTEQEETYNVNSSYQNVGQGTVGGIFAIYDGEKSQGEMGAPRYYTKDYTTLRARSRQLFIESELVQTIIMRKVAWVYGKGLDLKTEPNLVVLKAQNINLETEKFNEAFEAHWKTYFNSKLADYNGLLTGHMLAGKQYVEKKISGDVLVILYVKNGLVKTQLIDGGHVMNPIDMITIDYKDKNIAGYQGNPGFDYIYTPTGNRVREGVEIDKQGAHVAYHVRVGIDLKYQRVAARDSMGFLRAYMVYGMETDLDTTRGTPTIAVCMENAKKLERYFGAAILSAETRAKFAMFLTHDQYSVEDDGLAGIRVKSHIPHLQGATSSASAAAADIAIDARCEKIASDVTMTMPGMMVNLPRGVKPSFADSKQDLQVAEFTKAITEIICASQNIPVYVAMSNYDGSFSSARMGGKDWEHTFKKERAEEGLFLNPIKELQMYLWVQDGTIEAPGYLDLLKAKKELSLAAYNNCKWVGSPFPEVDDLKAANALRRLMGDGFEHMPLIEPDRAAEMSGNDGDYAHILAGSAKWLKLADSLGIQDVLDRGETVAGDGGGEENGEEAPPLKTTKK
jgi:capsid protein